MIILRPTNLHWIRSIDDPADLCAHSPVDFRIGDATLVKPGDGEWTVSASAVYLLRTLSQSHTKDQPVAEHLFPCCGNGMFAVEGQADVLIIGCNSGKDFEIIQGEDEVFLTTADGVQFAVSLSEWRAAVCQFADAVQAFYAASSPKKPEDRDDRAGFIRLTMEWARRRSLAELAAYVGPGAASTEPYPYHFPLSDPVDDSGPSFPVRAFEWFARLKF